MKILSEKADITFEALFNNSILGFPTEYPLIEYYENGVKKAYSKDEYIAKIDATAAALEKELAGIERGRWVGLRCRTHVYWFAAFMALEKLGYPVMFMDENCSGKAMQHCVDMGALAAVVSHTPVGIEGVRDISFEEVTAAETGHPGHFGWASEMCVCTSGTTMQSKSVAYKAEVILEIQKTVRASLFSSKEVIKSLETIPMSEARVLVTLPMRHIFGFQVPMIFWSNGCTMVFPATSGVFDLVESIKKERIWFTYGVPALWKAIFRVYKNRAGSVNEKTFREFFGAQFRYGMIGGARIEAEFKDMVISTGLVLANAYGGTETGGCISLGHFNTEPKNDIPGEYSGGTFNGHEAFILREDGTPVREGLGELAVTGKTIYSGSLENGRLISRLETEGPLYRTGDVFIIRDGMMYYQGRCTSMIVGDSGENIYPEELEEDLCTLSSLTDQFGVMGMDDEPVLLLHHPDLAGFERSELFSAFQKINAGLAHYKKITRLFVFSDPMPKTLKGEVDKKSMAAIIERCRTQPDKMKEIVLVGKRGNE